VNERWDKIEKLYHAARELDREGQSRFLDAACASDPEMRRQIDILLAQDLKSGTFLTRPAVEFASLAPRTRIGPYEIKSELGSGGMGVVFRARDTKLERDVALKFLPAHFAADPDRVSRFRREAQLLAALNHPNIAQIYGLEGADATAQPCIVMELVEGESLAERLKRGPIPAGEILGIVKQICEGLEAAHERGVIHRDLKPANVMITPRGQVKLLDFGVARMLPAADESPAGSERTLPGMIVGTPEYMSPEQALGEEVDCRTDIYSLGVLLDRLNSSSNARLEHVIRKCLARNRESRYPSARALLHELQDFQRADRNRSIRRALLASFSTLLLISAVLSWWFLGRRNPPPAIAVLPLENLGHDAAYDYFADGLTDEIISNLSVIDGLVVRSRTSSFALKSSPHNVRDAGKQLQADYILEGSVLRSGEKLRVIVQLVRVQDDFPMWSGNFDKEANDVFAIQDDISRGIVNNLRLKLGAGQRRYNTNLEAYELYLQARRNLDYATQLFTGGESAELFEKVLEKDRNFAPAYAGLAEVYAVRSVNNRGLPFIEATAKMKEYVDKALQLDPLLADAWAYRGAILARNYQWNESEEAFQKALKLNPNLPDAHEGYGADFLYKIGQRAKGIQQVRKAIELDPLSARRLATLSFMLVSDGRVEETLEAIDRLKKLTPSQFGNQIHGRVLLLQKRPAESIPYFSNPAVGNEGFLGLAYALTNQRSEAEAVLKSEKFANQRALTCAGLGDKDCVFEALNEMADAKDGRVHVYIVFPELALIRGDPRLETLKKKIGL
jgi:serine/threonine protein kinase/Tfp pilus assembly protein PilF